MLVANKIDLNDREDAVTEEEGKELAKKNGIRIFQTSAKLRIGVKELFVYAVDLYRDKFELEKRKGNNHIQTGEKKKDENNGCQGGKNGKNH